MPSVSITWHTKGDDNVCPICKALEGYKWTFKDEVPDSLVHPEYGEVWNMQIGSLAHEHQQFGMKYGLMSNCRCRVDGKVESLQDLADAVRKLKNELKKQMGEEVAVDDTKSGEYRRTTPEDIGIDLSQYGIE